MLGGIFEIVSEYIRENFVILLDHIGTFAFALSGIRLAAEKEFDWFGSVCRWAGHGYWWRDNA